jgi:ankyrin repeat protein
MLDLGFDPIARGVDNWEPIRWAAFHGNAEMTKRLLAYSPPINVPDPSYGGTLLGACIYGSVHGWHSQTGDFKTTAQILIEAGERVDPSRVPTGRDDVDAVLKKYLS